MKFLIVSTALTFSFFSSLAFGVVPATSAQNLLIAAVVATDERIEIWINTRENWLEEGALTDTYSEEIQILVDQITDETNLCNLQESMYEPCREGRSVDQLKRDLIRAGVEIDPEFQKWAENEIIE